jgi:hypothetical protein
LSDTIPDYRFSLKSSLLLWRAQCTLYVAMWVFAFIALLPFFLSAFYWLLFWFLFAGLMVYSLAKTSRAKSAESLTLDVKQGAWTLTSDECVLAVDIDGEVLLWSWLIILSFNEKITNKTHRIVVMRDSLSRGDWRRLCVCLKTSFV